MQGTLVMLRRQILARGALALAPLSLINTPLYAAIKSGSNSSDRDLEGITLAGKEITLPAASVRELATGLRGDVLLPGSASYETSRQLLNPSFNKHPALVVKASGAADVSMAVQYAADRSLLLAVKCGGHSASGKSTCNGGMQIDLSDHRGVYIDPVNKTALVAGGSLLAELDHEAMAHGLITTAGTVSHTGVGGLTLGGGFGRLARKLGLTIDNLLAVEIVTADGKIRHASEEHNTDLFWAVRGGGGNYGVVTAFKFQLHDMQPDVVAGSYVFPFKQATQVLEFFGEYSAQAPDELHVGAGIAAFPGRDPVVSINVVYAGDPADAQRVIAPVEKAGSLVKSSVKQWDYLALQKSGDQDDPRANGSYMKSGFVPSVTPALARAMVDNFEPSPTRATWMATQQSGGAINRVAPQATAFAHRDIGHNILSFVGWPYGTDATAHVAYIKQHWNAVEPFTSGFYSNDVFTEDQKMINSNYGSNYLKLAALKGRFDPENLFRLNTNIEPA